MCDEPAAGVNGRVFRPGGSSVEVVEGERRGVAEMEPEALKGC